MATIAPSILSADFSKIAEEIAVVAPHIKYLHVDVMDGHFVPNITFGPPVVKSLRGCTDLILDVHLMITDPEQYVPIFAKAGADIVTVHVEACDVPLFEKLAKDIQSQGKKMGISLRPSTDLDVIKPYLPFADLVLVMSVEPGFGGQSYMDGSTERLRTLRGIIDGMDREILLEVDGGINDKTAPEAIAAGTDILVAGSYVFKSDDYVAAIQTLLG